MVQQSNEMKKLLDDRKVPVFSFLRSSLLNMYVAPDAKMSLTTLTLNVQLKTFEALQHGVTTSNNLLISC